MQNRYFSPDPARLNIARTLYDSVKDLPLICPHGHVDPRLFASADYTWGTPVDLLITPDHYIFRLLYSQGIKLELLGIPREDGGTDLHLFESGFRGATSVGSNTEGWQEMLGRLRGALGER